MTEKKSIEKVEREYTIPLRAQVMKVPRYKRAKKAIRTIREFLVKHMQIRDRDLEKIKLDKYLNQMIWSRGIKTPPHKIKVKAIKEGEIVRVEAYELSQKLKFKKQKEEKREKKGEEAGKKKKAEKEDAEVKAEDKKAEGTSSKLGQSKAEEAEEKKKTTIEAEQKYEKQKAKERKHEISADKKPIQKKKEHSKGRGTGR